MALPEGALENAQAAGGREPLDRGDLGALELGRQEQAAPGGAAVHEDRAGAAHAVLAADVRAREPEILAEEVGERAASRDAGRHVPPVDAEAHRDLVHAASRPTASRTASSASTRTRWARYSAEACTSLDGRQSRGA